MNAWKLYRGYILMTSVLAVIVVSRLIPSLSDRVLGERVTHDLDNLVSRPYFRLGQLPITLAFLIKAVAYLLLLLFLSRFVRRVMQLRVLPRTSMESGQQYALARVVGYVIFLVGLMIGVQSAVRTGLPHVIFSRNLGCSEIYLPHAFFDIARRPPGLRFQCSATLHT